MSGTLEAENYEGAETELEAQPSDGDNSSPAGELIPHCMPQTRPIGGSKKQAGDFKGGQKDRVVVQKDTGRAVSKQQDGVLETNSFSCESQRESNRHL